MAQHKTLEEQIKFLENMAQLSDAKADEIERRYGVGVRPSWCSADIAIERATAQRYRGEAQKLRSAMQSRNMREN